jgi:hypothetical protein
MNNINTEVPDFSKRDVLTEIVDLQIVDKVEQYEKEIERLRTLLFHFTGEMEEVNV